MLNVVLPTGRTGNDFSMSILLFFVAAVLGSSRGILANTVAIGAAIAGGQLIESSVSPRGCALKLNTDQLSRRPVRSISRLPAISQSRLGAETGGLKSSMTRVTPDALDKIASASVGMLPPIP